MKEPSIRTDHANDDKTISPDVLLAYEQKAQEMWKNEDPRDQYTYLISKLNCDYTLMEKVGIRDKNILNVGCSFPIDEVYFARKVSQWTGIDISAESLRVADYIIHKELHPDLAAKFNFKYADACELPFEDNIFDLSISMSTFDHLPSAYARQKAVDEMARTTKPGGHVIVTTPNWWCIPYALGIWKMTRDKTLHYGYVYLYNPIELRQAGVKAGLIPVNFASSIAPPKVWLPGYPFFIKYPAVVCFGLMRLFSYFGRRIGYAFVKPNN